MLMTVSASFKLTEPLEMCILFPLASLSLSQQKIEQKKKVKLQITTSNLHVFNSVS